VKGVPSDATVLLSMKKRNDPRGWRVDVKAALLASGGFLRDRPGRPGAASILGVSLFTLKRWLREDPLLARVKRPTSGRPATPEKQAV
jgi:hypothetical protein